MLIGEKSRNWSKPFHWSRPSQWFALGYNICTLSAQLVNFNQQKTTRRWSGPALRFRQAASITLTRRLQSSSPQIFIQSLIQKFVRKVGASARGDITGRNLVLIPRLARRGFCWPTRIWCWRAGLWIITLALLCGAPRTRDLARFDTQLLTAFVAWESLTGSLNQFSKCAHTQPRETKGRF